MKKSKGETIISNFILHWENFKIQGWILLVWSVVFLWGKLEDSSDKIFVNMVCHAFSGKF